MHPPQMDGVANASSPSRFVAINLNDEGSVLKTSVTPCSFERQMRSPTKIGDALTPLPDRRDRYIDSPSAASQQWATPESLTP